MRAGQLRHRITIETPTESKDANHAVTRTWATYATVWANVEPLSGNEQVDAGKITAGQTVQITMRYYAGVTRVMRVSWSSRYFDIRDIVNVSNRNKELSLTCVERIN